MFITQTVKFQEVKRWGKKVGKCDCGKRRVRQTTICHTINPFNKNNDGQPKSFYEVLADVENELSQWKAEPIFCGDCEPPGFWELSKKEQDMYNSGKPVIVKNKWNVEYALLHGKYSRIYK